MSSLGAVCHVINHQNWRYTIICYISTILDTSGLNSAGVPLRMVWIVQWAIINECNCNLLVRYLHRPVMSGFGLYDPTSIMNAGELNRGKKEGLIKMAFYVISFFYYIYGYVLASFISLISNWNRGESSNRWTMNDERWTKMNCSF